MHYWDMARECTPAQLAWTRSQREGSLQGQARDDGLCSAGASMSRVPAAAVMHNDAATADRNCLRRFILARGKPCNCCTETWADGLLPKARRRRTGCNSLSTMRDGSVLSGANDAVMGTRAPSQCFGNRFCFVVLSAWRSRRPPRPRAGAGTAAPADADPSRQATQKRAAAVPSYVLLPRPPSPAAAAAAARQQLGYSSFTAASSLLRG